MKLISIDKAKNSDDRANTDLLIVLDNSSLTKVSMKILYMVEKNYRNFTLDFSSVTLPLDRVLLRVRKHIFSLLSSYDIHIRIKGFSDCVFYRKFFPSGLLYDFSDKISFFNPSEEERVNSLCTGLVCVDDCCEVSKVAPYEVIPEYSDEDVLNSYLDRLSNFWDSDLKEVCEVCLNDFMENSRFESRRLFFRELISSGGDEVKEGFYYRIFNSKSEFGLIFDFMKTFFGPNLDKFRDVLSKSISFTLAFEVLADGSFSKRLFFSTTKLSGIELEDLLYDLNTVVKDMTHVYGVEIDFMNVPVLKEVFYAYDKLDGFAAKRLFDGFELDSKMLFFKFVNSMTKDLVGVLVRDRYEDGVVVSRKFDIGCSDNLIKVKSIGILYSCDVGHLIKEDVLTMVFEVSKFSDIRILFYFTPKLPSRVVKEVEVDVEELSEIQE